MYIFHGVPYVCTFLNVIEIVNVYVKTVILEVSACVVSSLCVCSVYVDFCMNVCRVRLGTVHVFMCTYPVFNMFLV